MVVHNSDWAVKKTGAEGKLRFNCDGGGGAERPRL